MQKIKTALFGTGFVGRVHLEGIRRLGFVDLQAIGEPQIEKAQALAAEFGVPKTDADYRRILEDPSIEAVHVCTPNALHFPIAKDGAPGRQARDLRKAAGHVGSGSQGTGGARRLHQAPQLHVPQSALLPHGAADAPHA